MPEISLAEQIYELNRELALRRNVYPNWIRAGKLPSHEADRRIQRLEAALRTLQRIKALLESSCPEHGPAVAAIAWVLEAEDA